MFFSNFEANCFQLYLHPGSQALTKKSRLDINMFLKLKRKQIVLCKITSWQSEIHEIIRIFINTCKEIFA